MIEVDQKLLAEAIEEFEDVSDNLEETVDKNSSNSIYDSIAEEVDEAIVSPVLERARELGEPHVGDRVSEIEAVPGSWEGDRYVAGLRSDNTVVLSHEYGSGKYTTNGPYKIEPGPGKKALSFEIDGHPIAVKYVVHPGVRGKRFMREAIRQRSDEIMEDALDATQETLSEAFDT